MGWESDQTLGSLLLSITSMPFPCCNAMLDLILATASNVGSLQRKEAEIFGGELLGLKGARRSLANTSRNPRTISSGEIYIPEQNLHPGHWLKI